LFLLDLPLWFTSVVKVGLRLSISYRFIADKLRGFVLKVCFRKEIKAGTILWCFLFSKKKKRFQGISESENRWPIHIRLTHRRSKKRPIATSTSPGLIQLNNAFACSLLEIEASTKQQTENGCKQGK
jgi:hypothetical protein